MDEREYWRTTAPINEDIKNEEYFNIIKEERKLLESMEIEEYYKKGY